MAEPRKDTRKRDRAAYMRDYRANRAKTRPTIEKLAERVAALEAIVALLPGDIAKAARGIEVRRTVIDDPIASPHPAPGK